MTDGLEAARMAELDALRDFETIPIEETRDWRSLQWYLRGRSDERASGSALRAAARRVIKRSTLIDRCLDCWEAGFSHRDDCAIGALIAALDGAPWEPSEEQVERAAIALYGRGVDHEWAQTHPWESLKATSQDWWREEARAVLKAAMGSAKIT